MDTFSSNKLSMAYIGIYLHPAVHTYEGQTLRNEIFQTVDLKEASLVSSLSIDSRNSSTDPCLLAGIMPVPTQILALFEVACTRTVL